MKIISKITLSSAFCLILLLVVGYVFQTGQIVDANSRAKAGKLILENTCVENMDLQAKASNLASLKRMEQKIGQLNFVRATKIEYISIQGRNLSLNR